MSAKRFTVRCQGSPPCGWKGRRTSGPGKTVLHWYRAMISGFEKLWVMRDRINDPCPKCGGYVDHALREREKVA